MNEEPRNRGSFLLIRSVSDGYPMHFADFDGINSDVELDDVLVLKDVMPFDALAIEFA